MSMPSDVTPDVTEAMGQRGPIPARRDPPVVTIDLTPQQVGFAVAALVAFLGVAVVGPRIAAIRRPARSRVKDRAQRTVEEARRQAMEMGRQTGKRLRRLGGGPIWR